MSVKIYVGDCIDHMSFMADQSVHCCITSPPYFGLRDYGVEGQIGLEQTPAEFVAKLVDVFREVRRVLRDDGTLWLNLGDSYASTSSYNAPRTSGGEFGRVNGQVKPRAPIPTDLKPKDLISIPWMTAKALQAPYYAGRIKSERDRAWIAAMIDGEGTICGFHHIRSGGAPRTGAHVTITNSDTLLLDEAHRIWPASRTEHQRPSAGHLGTRVTWRWIVHGAENKMAFLREVYPYLIAKKRQAMVAYNLLLMMPDAKSVGHSAGRDAAREKRAALVQMLTDLNQRRPVDLPPWLIEPPSVLEPGYYLRQDIIWAKPNPMPESVRDRCTKAHEYLFLLAKSERYYFDSEAMKEPAVAKTPAGNGFAGRQGGAGYMPMSGGEGSAEPWRPRSARDNFKRTGSKREQAIPGQAVGTHREDRADSAYDPGMRNRRSVWTVATRPFKGAHFATFPPDLIEPCVLAGCPAGGVVLDPFGGAGTTGLVAQRHGRSAVLCELNPEYAALAEARIAAEASDL